MENHEHDNSALTQANIWKKFVNGDYSCFKQLFHKHYKVMYGYGVKLCENPELVKDSIQDLFVTLWERRETLDHINSPKVYLYVSLRRNILRQLKKDQKFNGKLINEDSSDFAEFGMEEFIIKKESIYQQKQKVLKALNRLSPRQREVVYLYFFNGMSYEEIEKILIINRQSVHNLMHRAMKTLRSQLKEDVVKGLYYN